MNTKSFNSNLLTLFSGTGFAQGIVFLSSYFTTRIYTPSDFGYFSFYSGILTFIVAFSALKLDNAIILPNSKKELNVLLSSILFGALLVSFGCGLILILLIPFLSSKQCLFFLFLPINSIVVVYYSCIIQYLIRSKDFLKFSKVIALLAIVQVIFQIVLGYLFGQYEALVLGSFLGIFSVIVVFSKNLDIDLKQIIGRVHPKSLKVILSKYGNFPKYNLPNDLLIIVNSYSIPQLLLLFFSPGVSGLFVFANKLTRVPIAAIGSSVSNIFKTMAKDEMEKTGKVKSSFNYVVKRSFLISGVLLLGINIIIPYLFGDYSLFDTKFQESILIVRYLSVLVLFEFLLEPIKFVYIIANKQKVIFLVTTLTFLINLAVFLILKYLDRQYIDIVLAYVIISTLSVIILFFISKKVSEKTSKFSLNA